jgi:glutamine synthetase
LQDALGEHILNSVIQNKTIEWGEYRATVTDYETSKYLPIL